MPLYAGAIAPLSDAVSGLVQYQLTAAEQSMTELTQLKDRLFQLFLLLFMIVGGCVLFFGMWTGSSVSQPLAAMSQVLRGTQIDLDLSQQAPVLRKDEMGALAQSFNQVISHFRGLINQINEMAEHLAKESARLAHIGMESRQRFTQQQAETDQSATAMNQISATVNSLPGRKMRPGWPTRVPVTAIRWLMRCAHFPSAPSAQPKRLARPSSSCSRGRARLPTA